MSKKTLLYNNEIKQKFLNEIENPDNRLIVEYTLRNASKTEVDRDKDLFDMSIEEIEDIMYSLACSTATSAYNNATRLDEYIAWAAEHGYRASNITPFDG